MSETPKIFAIIVTSNSGRAYHCTWVLAAALYPPLCIYNEQAQRRLHINIHLACMGQEGTSTTSAII